MTTREALGEIMERMGEEELREVLDFARFLSGRPRCSPERGSRGAFALEQLERAYVDDEPAYTEADLKSRSSA